MRKLSYLFCSSLLLCSCYSSPRIPTVSFETITPENIVHNWAQYAAYAGGLLIFIGVICFVWVNPKSIAVRCMANGFAFVIVSRLMSFLGDYMGWCLLVCLLAGLIFNVKRVEKMLAKMGWRVDLNRDGRIGTDTFDQDSTVELDAIDLP